MDRARLVLAALCCAAAVVCAAPASLSPAALLRERLGGARTLGFYLLVADDTDPTYNSTTVWTPQLYPYQQAAGNVLFLTFINPALLPAVPPGMAALAKSRGTSASGAPPAGTVIMFSLGGEYYSEGQTWAFLASVEAAEAMAAQVAQWPQQYGCDGIDIDLETGAGAAWATGVVLAAFVAKIKTLNPQMIVTLPVFGSPSSVLAANAMLTAAYNASTPGNPPGALGSLSAVGIMVYEGTDAVQYVPNYVDGCSRCSQYYCPLPACVPPADILLGVGGGEAATDILALADAAVAQSLGGIMGVFMRSFACLFLWWGVAWLPDRLNSR